MKKTLLLFLIFFGVNQAVFSQNAQDLIDNLKTELKSNPDQKRTASIYSDLTWYYANVSTDSAIVYGKKAIAESVKLKDSVLLAQVYSDLGAVYFRKTDYLSSKKSYVTAYNIRKIRNDKVGMAKVSANLANVYNKEGNKTLALKSYLESVDYFEKINNLEAASLTNANIGSLFMDLKNYTKSKEYTTKAIDYQEKNNQDVGLSTSYLTMGNIYLRLKDTINALKYYDKSLISSKKSSNNVAISSALNNISNIKIAQNKDADAKILMQKSDAITKKVNPNVDESALPMNLVANYISNKEFNKAQEKLFELKKQYSKNDKDNVDLNQVYLYLAQTNAFLNQPDSVNYYTNQSLRLQDNIIEKTVAKQTNELETKYQTAKKEQQIINSRNKLIALAIITFFIALIGFLIYRQQKLKNKQQEQEFQLQSAIKEIETQNKLQEQRLSISRDLHDNIGAQLTFIISSVDNLKFGNKSLDEKITNQLSKISNFTKSTIVELRDTIWAMNSNDFSFEDLRSRIFNFIEKAQSAKEDVKFNFNIDSDLKDIKLSAITGINVYRTIQEAVNNAVKYANPTTINVEVKAIENSIQVIIQDDGNGFDIESTKLGNGLYNMKKRIEEIDGEFEINSLPEKGTRVFFTINKNQ